MITCKLLTYQESHRFKGRVGYWSGEPKKMILF